MLIITSFLLTVWFLLMPVLSRIVLIQDYTLSRILGLFIIFINTVLFPFHKLRLVYLPVLLSVTTFILYCIMLTIVYPSPSAYDTLFRLYGWQLLLIVFLIRIGPSNIHIVKAAIISVGVICALYTIVQYVVYLLDPHFAIQLWGVRGIVIDHSTLRPQGLLGSAGGSAFLISFPLILFLKEVLTKHIGSYRAFLSIVLLIGLLLNFTRTAIFLLAVFMIINLLIYRQFVRMFVLVLFTLCVTATTLLFVDYNRYTDRFTDLKWSEEMSDSDRNRFAAGRLLLLSVVLDKYRGLPFQDKLIGKGLHWTNSIIKETFGIEGNAHNDMIWLLSNVGYIGTILYLLIVYSLSVMHKYKWTLFYVSFVVLYFFLGGIGGETITITGHKYMQVIMIAYLFNDDKLQDIYRNGGKV